jgi:nucleoside-diphosphate-sugar epimerase
MASAFVTGGSGFIGGRLIERLRAEGLEVRALARSYRAAEAVGEHGAEPVRGDLDSVEAICEGADGCDLAFHAAAKTEDWGDREEFVRVNVDGTANVLAACRQAGVRRFVHVGTEAALLAGQPLVNVSETAPLRPDSPVHYSATKALAEQAVRDANVAGFETVVVRPRFVWGRGDTTLLPVLVETVEGGRFRWIGGGGQRTSTTHVDNTVEGLWLGATRGAPGGVYFVTDGEPVVFREFVSELLRTQGVEPPDKNLPVGVARTAAGALERVARRRRPPLTRFAVWVSALECTIDITRARTELGYEPVRTVPDGLRELASASS